MANRLQWIIYNLANVVPILGMTAVAWFIQFKDWRIPGFILTIAVIIAMLFRMSFLHGKKNCLPKTIIMSSITSKDQWIFGYILTYLLPFSYLIISDYHTVTLSLVFLGLLLAILPALLSLPNVILSFLGYHFYEVGIEGTGITDYLLISKRKIRNRNEIKTVVRLFERILIDWEGEP